MCSRFMRSQKTVTAPGRRPPGTRLRYDQHVDVFDDGGDPPCWAHLFDDSDEMDTPGGASHRIPTQEQGLSWANLAESRDWNSSTEDEAAVIPVNPPASQAPWPPPVASTVVSGLKPPIDHSERPSNAPRRHRLAIVAVVLVLLAAAGGVVRVESRQSGATSSPTATTRPPTTPRGSFLRWRHAAECGITARRSSCSRHQRHRGARRPSGGRHHSCPGWWRGAGTGMVLTPSGLVLTNNHVIDGATKISVQIVGHRSQPTRRTSSVTTSWTTSPWCKSKEFPG